MELPMRFRMAATMSMNSAAVGAPVEGAGVAAGAEVSLVRIKSER